IIGLCVQDPCVDGGGVAGNGLGHQRNGVGVSGGQGGGLLAHHGGYAGGGPGAGHLPAVADCGSTTSASGTGISAAGCRTASSAAGGAVSAAGQKPNRHGACKRHAKETLFHFFPLLFYKIYAFRM